jgi:cytochrome c oxidase subunit 2
MKMDAVPGTPTTMWFTPKYTTEEMRKKTGKADFNYEISCDQICGVGHYTMRGTIQVVNSEEFILWRAKQKPVYVQNFPEKDLTNPVKADSTKTAAVVMDDAATKMIAKKN